MKAPEPLRRHIRRGEEQPGEKGTLHAKFACDAGYCPVRLDILGKA